MYLSVECSHLSGTALLCVKFARIHPLVLLKTVVLNLYANASTKTPLVYLITHTNTCTYIYIYIHIYII